MKEDVALTADQAEILRAILLRHLTPGTRCAIFGSRAHGPVKPWSDLDLAIEGDGPIPLEVIAELNEAFDASPLPWKVDVVDRRMVSDAFAAIIDASAVPFA